MTAAQEQALADADRYITQLTGQLQIRVEGIGRFLLNGEHFTADKITPAMAELQGAHELREKLQTAHETFSRLRQQCDRPPVKKRARKV
jgi:hypothetical protein